MTLSCLTGTGRLHGDIASLTTLSFKGLTCRREGRCAPNCFRELQVIDFLCVGSPLLFTARTVLPYPALGVHHSCWVLNPHNIRRGGSIKDRHIRRSVVLLQKAHFWEEYNTPNRGVLTRAGSKDSCARETERSGGGLQIRDPAHPKKGTCAVICDWITEDGSRSRAQPGIGNISWGLGNKRELTGFELFSRMGLCRGRTVRFKQSTVGVLGLGCSWACSSPMALTTPSDSSYAPPSFTP